MDRYNELQARLFLGAKALIQGIGANPKRSPNLVVFLSGVHRSGTNITMRILERSIDTDVFHESDARAFDNYMMRGEGKLRELIGCSNSKRVIFKALHEAHELRNLMIKFSPSKSLWIYRHFDEVVASIMRRWPGLRNMMDEIITKRETGGWRGLGMTSRTRQLLASWYHESMNDATITALFWYQRNQLLFDQGLHRDKDCLLVDYAVLTNSPLETIRRICTFLDITYSSRMPALIRARSTVRVPPPPIEPDVREVCEELYERLVATSLVARGDSGGADAA